MPSLEERIANLTPAQQKLLARRLGQTPAASRIPPREIIGPVPASPIQTRWWFLNQLEPDDPAPNRAKLLEFEGLPETETLRRALETIIQRHEALRTVFFFREGQLYQQILDEWELPFAEIDLREAEDDEVRTFIRGQIREPFHLGEQIPIRGALLRVGPARSQFLIVNHHIAGDHWSSQIILRELTALLRGETLPAVPLQYADFAVWQAARLAGGLLDEQLAYWRRQLAGEAPVLELPELRRAEGAPPTDGARHSAALPAELLAGLQALARAAEATLPIVILAVFKVLLHRYSG